MFTIHDHVEYYAQRDYVAASEAQMLFQSFGESEIGRRIREMSSLVKDIEVVLKQKVRQNYQLFLQTNDEISRVGLEMSDLQTLIESIRVMLLDIRRMREEGKGQSNTAVIKAKVDRLNYLIENNMSYISDSVDNVDMDVSDVPAWFLRSPEDLVRCMVEQEYDSAVNIVITTRKFIELEKSNISLNTNAMIVARKIEDRAMVLGSTLARSLSELSNSLLWGRDEVNHRLRLLISFGCTRIAAEGFFKSHADIMKKIMLSVSATGDIFTYIDDITAMFFDAVNETSSAFLGLFTGKDDTDTDMILSLIIQWCIEQMSSYVAILSKQLHMVVNEYTSSAVMMLRSRAMSSNPFGDDSSDGGGEDDDLDDKEADKVNANDDDDENFNYDAFISNRTSSYRKMSPMRFVFRVISTAYKHCNEFKQRGLNLGAALGWQLQHEIGKLVNQFADNMILELKAQVSQEHWSFVTDKYVMSYLWIFNAVDYLVKEFSVLLQIKHVGDAKTYSRSDFCGIESTAAAATLRLLVAFIIEMESVSLADLISDQIVAYIETVHKISDELIPTVYNLISGSFFIEDDIVFGDENNSTPRALLHALTKRCDSIIRYAEGKLNSY